MRNIRNIFIISLAILGGWLLGTHVAHAQNIVANLFGFDNLMMIVAEILAQIINFIQMGAGWILALSGFLLNYSINLTLQMKSFLQQTPAVFTTWKALRDISGLFIIFTLLYAALRLILGLQDAKFGTLIKNIVIAGVVINFSFFFAGLGIDVSNIVSIQLYNAIAPANSLNAGNLSPAGLVNRSIGSSNDGGLSDIFMKSLKIPALYNTNGSITPAASTAAAGGAWTAPIKIMMIGIASIMIMITAALSFAAAALAFVIRFVVLIFLLAFSPIWFASHIVPEIGKYAEKWTSLYKGMLVFMPVYLLLMYLALSVLTTTPLLTGVDLASAASTNSTTWYSSIMTLVINAVIVIVLLNFPLVAAVSISGGILKFINTDKIGAAGMWGGLGRWTNRNTVGRAAYRLNESEALRGLSSRVPGLGLMASKGLSALSSNGFGDKKASYEATLKAQKKAQEDLYKRVGTVNRSLYSDKASADQAEKDAKAMQAEFRRNLPYENTVLNFMLNGRAGRETAEKLNKEAAKKQAKSDLEKNKKLKADMEREMKDLEKEMDSDSNPVGFGRPKPPKIESIAKIDTLKKGIKDLEDKIKEGEEAKSKESFDDLVKKVGDSNKEEKGGDEEKKSGSDKK
ncbi:MAG: hypothetical protein AAB381_01495 [Patescibacteria group bacterium]